MPSKHKQKHTFIDVFSGCGGLSLGLMQGGFKGLFAVEQDENAFKTLRTNLLREGNKIGFHWPSWLRKEPYSIESLLECHYNELTNLKGHIDLVAGGPPCQGFSAAGRRREDDPRNQLFRSYVEFVRAVQPRALLLENVKGFAVNFTAGGTRSNYASKLRTLLETDYTVHEELINLSQFGVPQSRTRYFLIAFRHGTFDANPFDLLRIRRSRFLRKLGLRVPVSAWSAISDFETSRAGTRPSSECKGFEEICHKAPLTSYQKLMSCGVEPTDLRLARHRPVTVERFKEFIKLSHAEGRLNTSINEDLRQRFGIRKRAFRVLDPDRPAPTITSMPDDLLHYQEPRTLTVRENARLQSFPDWFAFQGVYTTGGHRRRQQIPRFTQVANAVPPLMAHAIGETLSEVFSAANRDEELVVREQDSVQLTELGSQFKKLAS